MQHIRNFSIIAHIDHGKSTLADRFIQRCGGLSDREMSEQVLDSMDLEKERGITIKAQTAALSYKARDGQIYNLNLIDTPGHVDFAYEVSRSLSACEGALLVVDASQGVEAQTVANCYTATELGVEVVPVLNKIDLPNAEPERVKEEIAEVVGVDASDAVLCSAKTGIGIDDILEAVIAKIPPPKGDPTAPLKALIIDSWFDSYVGVVMLVRVFEGTLKPKEKITFMATGRSNLCEQVGVFAPQSTQRESLSAGQVGFIIAGIKELDSAKVGDTVTHALKPAATALPGFKEVKPQVFAGLYPIESNQYEALRDALQKLKLNDASLHYEPEVSQALGFGFRCGFLGLLHMDVVQERLEREYDMDLITTAPTVIYQVVQRDGTTLSIENPAKLPDLSRVEDILEPIITATILMPQEYVGSVMTLCNEKRGTQVNMQYMGRQVMLTYDLPMAEVVMDFFDAMKSRTKGYASLDYEPIGYDVSDLVKLIAPSVVRVKVNITQSTPFGTQSGTGEGTGVILTADGELLTNAHVVDGATNVTVTTSDGKNHPAKVLGVDAADDIAVVKITDATNLTPATLGASSKAIVGEPVVAVGNALGLDGAPSVTTGIVSALNRSLDDETSSLHGLIQTDAAINHGNSGGPLLNARGEVIGINTAIAADANNIGFAIAIDNVKPLIGKLEKGEQITSANTYLGISTQTVSDDIRAQLGLNTTTGAVIGEVVANTPAERAGLRANDVVTKANGVEVTSAQQLTSIVHHLSPGDHLKLTVERDKKIINIDATLGTRGVVPA